jgi:hypothetical protein
MELEQFRVRRVRRASNTPRSRTPDLRQDSDKRRHFDEALAAYAIGLSFVMPPEDSVLAQVDCT